MGVGILATRRARIWWTAWLFSLISAESSFGQAPNAEEILQALANRHYLTLYAKATWEELERGTRQIWEDQTIYRDDLGRIQMVRRTGKYDAQGRSRMEGITKDSLYDGEKTVMAEIFTTVDGDGKPLSSGMVGGYRTVQIFSGKWPPPNGLEHSRQPVTFADTTVRYGLEESIADDRPVEVREVGTIGAYEIVFRRDSSVEPDPHRYVALLDRTNGWAVRRVELFDASDRRIKLEQYEYLPQSSPFPLVKSGSMKYLGTDSTESDPKWEWRFIVHDIKVNDPAFPRDVFAVRLPPNTAVSDLRYKVNYRVGAEAVFDKDLRRLAEIARPKMPPIRNQEPPSSAWPMRFLSFGIGTAVLLVIAVVGYLSLRKR